MSDWVITEHAIVKKDLISSVQVKSEYCWPVRFSIVGLGYDDKEYVLYCYIKHEEIPDKIKIIANQLTERNI